MTRLEGESIAVDLPAGWEGRIAARDRGASPHGTAAADPSSGTSARLHAANFALPPDIADFGGGAVELMGNRDLLVMLFEYDRASASAPLFAAKGIPRLSPDDFDPYALQQVLPGQGGAQRFFNVARRAFCLYVVLGSHARRFRTVPLVNDVLASTRIS
ncbi:MAG: hypothetical protein QOK06_813 [Acidimicrobiaceae bacterium]